ncbi:MAG: DUF3014 domain-containing protein [Cellvibrionaceae bacterium]|nr:DUF3014 domain-containing protein [Cellvibrionaceae bacterium]
MTDNEYKRDKSLPVLLVIIAAVLIAGAVYWLMQRDKPSAQIAIPPEPPLTEAPAEIPVQQDETVAPVDPLVESPADQLKPPPKLPPLDRSDADVIGFLLEASEGSFQSWLIQEHLIRKFVRAMNALEEGKLVSQYRPFNDPEVPFKASNSGETWRIDANNFERYTPYLASLEQVGPERLGKIYEHYYPLLQQAYEELGVKKGDFRQVTVRALTRITKAPMPPQDASLSRPSVTYRFSAADLEQRSPVEKLLFRMGPENAQRLKNLAEQLLTQLQ